MLFSKTKNSLKFTGERIVTSINEYWTLEHLHRYAIVTELVKGKVVVDIASGEGYGSNILSEYAEKVIGIDISLEAITHARVKYKKNNLNFLQGDVLNIELGDSSVDVIVSFETIEHHDEHDRMFIEFKRILKEDGLLVISSPEKSIYSDKDGYRNPFHVKELYLKEFENILKIYFSNTSMLYQKSVVASIISTNFRCNESLQEFNGDYDNLVKHSYINEPLYNICVASNIGITNEILNFNSFFCNEILTKYYFQLHDDFKLLKIKNDLLEKKVNSMTYKLGRLLTYPLRMFKPQ